jgi:hypothetical protein
MNNCHLLEDSARISARKRGSENVVALSATSKPTAIGQHMNRHIKVLGCVAIATPLLVELKHTFLAFKLRDSDNTRNSLTQSERDPNKRNPNRP